MAFLIDIIEHPSRKVNTIRPYWGARSVQSHAAISSNLKRLAVYMARSISRFATPHHIELAVRAAHRILIEALLVENGKELRAIDKFDKLFRDFSLSTMAGEFGQAITYAFAMEHLGYLNLVDFEDYAITRNIKRFPRKLKTPDYVGKKANTLALFESKGSIVTKRGAKLKKSLKTAILQCRSGKRFLEKKGSVKSIKNIYGVLVQLATYSSQQKTVIHFADPDEDFTELPPGDRTMQTLHYSNWLNLAGFPRDAIGLRLGEKLRPNFETEEVILNESKYLLFQRNRRYFPYYVGEYPFWFPLVQFGFSRSVFDYLKRNTPDIDLPKSQLQAFGDFEIFPDGTIVKFPSNEDFEKFIRCLNA